MCTKVSSFLKPLLFLALSGLSISLWPMQESAAPIVTSELAPKRLCVAIEKYDRLRDFEAIKKISAEGSGYGIGMAALFMSGAVKVARTNDMTVGFIDYIMYEGSELVPAYAHVEYLGVAKDMRGKGIGRQLLAHAMQDVALHGFNCIGLKVFRYNLPAIGLYDSMGFVEKPGYGNFVTEMVCPLRSEPKVSRRCASVATAFSWMASWISGCAKPHAE